jgi:PAS domain S-box-containing protein
MSSRIERLRQSTSARYLFGAAMAGVALALRLILVPWTGDGAPFLLFFPAPAIPGLVAGAGPGLLVLVISMSLGAYLFVVRAGDPVPQAAFQALLYSVDGLILLRLTTIMLERRRSLADANGVLHTLRADAELAASRIREVIELAPDPFFQADLDARFTDVNQAACRLLGYERDELVGKTIFEIIPAEDVSRLEKVRAKLLAPGTTEKGEWTLRRKDGGLVPVDVSANILSDGRWQAFVRDITERRRIEDQRQVIADERERLLAREQETVRHAESANAQLRESEERFRLTIENAPIGMALVGLDGRFVRVNRALCELTGYSADELVTRRFQDITHPADLDTDVGIAERLARGDIRRYQFEKRYVRKDGSIVEALLSVSILRNADDSPRYFISQMQDITERKRDEHALRVSEAALQRAVTLRDDVLRVVAHDLRNPLNAITMQTSAMERMGPEPERRNPQPRQLIAQAAARMNQLIQDLLDVALVEAGQLPVSPARLSTAELVRDAVEMQKPAAAAEKLTLRSEITDDVRDVWGERKRLLQVFENLIGNAIKFTDAGGEILVTATPTGDEVVFSVRDTGAGLSRDAADHVFDRFWQAATKAKRLGAGLGLPITKGIVEAHGGRIWVESVPGQGTTFSFAIPAARHEQSSSPPPTRPRDTKWRDRSQRAPKSGE